MFSKKSFFIIISIVSGFGFRQTLIRNLDGITEQDNLPAAPPITRMALGFELPPFYIREGAFYIIRDLDYTDFTINYSTEHFRFCIGKQFDIIRSKLAKTLNFL